MYPGYNAQHVLQEERVRGLLSDARPHPPIEMTRFSRLAFPTVRFALVCLLLFGSGTAVMSAPVQDDLDLGALLLPAGCDSPCFLGIRPGVTTVEEAVALLQASPAVASIQLRPFSRYNAEAVEAYVSLPAERVPLVLYAENGIVTSITVTAIHLRMGDIVQLLGEPDQLVLSNILHVGMTTYAAFYPDSCMAIVITVSQSTSDMTTVWGMEHRASIDVGSAAHYNAQTAYYLPGVAAAA